MSVEKTLNVPFRAVGTQYYTNITYLRHVQTYKISGLPTLSPYGTPTIPNNYGTKWSDAK